MKGFDCLDCVFPTTLDEHGRCSRCGSNAVAASTGTSEKFFKPTEVVELERMYRL